MSREHLAAFLLSTAVLTVVLVLALSGGTSATELTPPPIVESGDPRSEGSGPGIVGSPLIIALGVVALGATTAVATAAAVKLGQRR